MAGKKGMHVNVEKECECGRVVKGMNKSILIINMETHKRGKQHKELMILKEHWISQSQKPRSHTKSGDKK